MNLDHTKIAAEELLKVIEAQPDKKFLKVEKAGKEHLIWMCNEIIKNYNKWNVQKLNRWLGFIQGIMVAIEITTVDKQRDLITEIFTK